MSKAARIKGQFVPDLNSRLPFTVDQLIRVQRIVKSRARVKGFTPSPQSRPPYLTKTQRKLLRNGIKHA